MEAFSVIEQAYAKIKGVTGLSNINDVVQKIFTKENNYNMLMNMINESTIVCEKYKRKNKEIENGIQEYNVKDIENKKNPYEAFQKTLIKKLKTVTKTKEKLTEIKRVKTFICEWVRLRLRKINPAVNIEETDMGKFFQVFRNSIRENIILLKQKTLENNRLAILNKESRSYSFNEQSNNKRIDDEANDKKNIVMRRNTVKVL